MVALDCCFSFLSPNRFRPQEQNGLHRDVADHVVKDDSISCSITSTQMDTKLIASISAVTCILPAGLNSCPSNLLFPGIRD